MDDRPRIATQPNRDILQAFQLIAEDIADTHEELRMLREAAHGARKCLEEILSLQDATDIPSPKRLEVVFQSATEALSWLSGAGIDKSADET